MASWTVSMIVQAIRLLAAAAAVCGIGYYLLCLLAVRSFRRALLPSPGAFAPPVSVLKPLRGIDPDLYPCLRSHCAQDYSTYEVLFGVSDAADPALPLVERLIQEFPQRRIRLVICPHLLGPNVKVSNLIHMLAHTDPSHQYLLVNDSDILVQPDYLRRVMAVFANPRVGMVTSLYRGIPKRSLGSRLEALGINTEFSGGVLAARVVERGIRFALGSTMALHRRALAAMGGLEAVVDYLADDFEIGKRISQAGFDVILSDVVVDNYLPDYSFGDFLRHQLRWGRSTRISRPLGYLGVVFTFGLPWAALAALAAGGAPWSLALLALALLLRLLVAVAVGYGVLHDRRALADLWLVPVRDLIAVWLWFASYAGSTVDWRGEQFAVKQGKLELLKQR